MEAEQKTIGTNEFGAGGPPDGTMPIMEHLTELRIRLIRCFIAVVIGVLAAYFFRKEILDAIRKPATRCPFCRVGFSCFAPLMF